MIQILLNDKIYSVEGDDAVLLREAISATTAAHTAEIVKSSDLSQKVDSLEAKLKQSDQQLNEAQAIALASKTKLDEAIEKSQNDAAEKKVDVDEIIKDRLELWSQVLPSLRADDANYEPDYSRSPLEIKLEYLMNACQDRPEIIQGLKDRQDKLETKDPGALQYVDALFTAFPPSSQKTKNDSGVNHTDSVLSSIFAGKAQQARNDAQVIDYRAELTRKLEEKNGKR